MGQPPSEGEPVPGNYLLFDFFIEVTINGKVQLAWPCRALHLMRTPPVVRWGAKMDSIVPNEKTVRIRWVDAEGKGFSGRTLTAAEECLGLEGSIAGKECCFEKILDNGKNVVVFSLYFYEQQFRLAYGFGRSFFQGSSGSV